MIQKCLEACPCLTIGVVSDELIRKYKKHNPAVDEKFRCLLLSVLYPECDVVLINGDKYDERTIVFVKSFDVVFRSCEYKDKPSICIPDDFDGNIVFIPYTFGISSSMIRHNILWGD